MSRLILSIVRGPLDEDAREPMGGALSGEVFSFLFSLDLSYDWIQVVKLTVYDDIIHTFSVELEFP